MSGATGATGAVGTGGTGGGGGGGGGGLLAALRSRSRISLTLVSNPTTRVSSGLGSWLLVSLAMSGSGDKGRVGGNAGESGGEESRVAGATEEVATDDDDRKRPLASRGRAEAWAFRGGVLERK